MKTKTKTIYFFVAMLFTTPFIHAQQQKISDGTATDNSVPISPYALLELRSAQKGLLLPRVALKSTASSSPMAANKEGMVVYNTATVNDVTPGCYYNTGSGWKRITAATGAMWDCSGNTGTTAGTNFIGTIDTTDFVTKTNSYERTRVTKDGQVLVGKTNNTTLVNNTVNNTKSRVIIDNSGVAGAIQIKDGSQSSGYVLTSDSDGVATWTNGNSTAWTLKGNSGITANAATYGNPLSSSTGSFVGTTNSADFILAANNKEGLRINTGQQVLVGTISNGGNATPRLIIDNNGTKGAIQIKDGTQGLNKVLKCFDDQGNASWVASATSALIMSYAPVHPFSRVIEGMGGYNAQQIGPSFTITIPGIYAFSWDMNMVAGEILQILPIDSNLVYSNITGRQMDNKLMYLSAGVYYLAFDNDAAISSVGTTISGYMSASVVGPVN